MPYVQDLLKTHGIVFDPAALVRLRQSAIMASAHGWEGQLSTFLLGYVSAFISVGLIMWISRCFKKPALVEPSLPISSTQVTGGTRLPPANVAQVRELRVRTHSIGSNAAA